MIIVRVELLSAVSGENVEIARMHIYNEGGSQTRGDYDVRVLRGRGKDALDRAWGTETYTKRGKVTNHARLQEHVWNLVGKALGACGYKH